MKGKVIHFCWLLMVACICQGSIYPESSEKKAPPRDTYLSSGKSIFSEKSLFSKEGSSDISKDDEEMAEAPPTFPDDGEYNPGGTIGNDKNMPLSGEYVLVFMSIFYLAYFFRKKKKYVSNSKGY